MVAQSLEERGEGPTSFAVRFGYIFSASWSFGRFCLV